MSTTPSSAVQFVVPCAFLLPFAVGPALRVLQLRLLLSVVRDLGARLDVEAVRAGHSASVGA